MPGFQGGGAIARWLAGAVLAAVVLTGCGGGDLSLEQTWCVGNLDERDAEGDDVQFGWPFVRDELVACLEETWFSGPDAGGVLVARTAGEAYCEGRLEVGSGQTHESPAFAKCSLECVDRGLVDESGWMELARRVYRSDRPVQSFGSIDRNAPISGCMADG